MDKIKISTLMSQHDISTEALAAASDLSYFTVRNILLPSRRSAHTGKRPVPQQRTMKALAAGLSTLTKRPIDWRTLS